jgi:hypothetical protein
LQASLTILTKERTKSSSNTTVLTSTGRLLPTNHLPRTLLFAQIHDKVHCCHPFDDAQDNLEAPNKLASTTSALQTNKALKFFTFIPTYSRKKQKLNLKSISWWLQDLLLH